MSKKEQRALELGITVEELEKWDEKLEKTFKALKGKKKILDPFVGWIEKK